MIKYIFIIITSTLFLNCPANGQSNDSTYTIPRASLSVLGGTFVFLDGADFLPTAGIELDLATGKRASWVIGATGFVIVREGSGITVTGEPYDPTDPFILLITGSRRWYSDNRVHTELGLSTYTEFGDETGFIFGIHAGLGKHIQLNNKLGIMFKTRLHALLVSGGHSLGFGIYGEGQVGLRIGL